MRMIAISWKTVWTRRGLRLATLAAAGLAWSAVQTQEGLSKGRAQPAQSSEHPAREGGADGAKNSAEGAQKAFNAGKKAYEAGRYEPAVQALSAALQQGLPKPEMAKAFYYRGMAYRKLSKPALAIADLTSAIWLKGGLAERERAEAMAAREAAYREAGIGEKSVPPLAAAAGSETGSGSAAAPAEAGSSGPRLAAAPDESSGEAGAAAGSGWGGGLFSGFLHFLAAGAAEPAPGAHRQTKRRGLRPLRRSRLRRCPLRPHPRQRRQVGRRAQP